MIFQKPKKRRQASIDEVEDVTDLDRNELVEMLKVYKIRRKFKLWN